MFDFLKKRKPKQHRPKGRRAYAAAKVDRLTASWQAAQQSINKDLEAGGRMLRSRARDLSQNNDYAKKYLRLVVANVVGSNGITLQSKVKTAKGKSDDKANRIVEQSFKEWSKAQNCSWDGRYTFTEMQRLFIETAARDGECLVRIIRDNSKFGFKLQFLDTNRLDENVNKDLGDGRFIRMGIEFDKMGKPVAYHLLLNVDTGVGVHRTERIPAEDMIHAFKAERPEQIRAGSWMASAMSRLQMLGAYEEAELVAARVGASKMGFYTLEAGDSFVGDDVDDYGNLISEAEPGVFEQLPAGTSFTSFDPQHPTSAFKDFNKAIIRGIAGGLGVSYNSLSSDLEGVSFSSIRSGTLEERDQWRVKQDWMINHFLERIYSEWLFMQLLKETMGSYTMVDYDKLSAIRWQPRGWSWVDPLKDIQASKEAIQAGIKTTSQVIAEQGGDIEDIYEQLAQERELAKSKGLNLSINDEVTNEQTNQDG